MPYCKECGTEVKEDFEFCQKCGVARSNPSEGSSQKFNFYLIVVALFSVVILVSLYLVFWPSSNVSTTTTTTQTVFTTTTTVKAAETTIPQTISTTTTSMTTVTTSTSSTIVTTTTLNPNFKGYTLDVEKPDGSTVKGVSIDYTTLSSIDDISLMVIGGNADILACDEQTLLEVKKSENKAYTVLVGGKRIPYKYEVNLIEGQNIGDHVYVGKDMYALTSTLDEDRIWIEKCKMLDDISPGVYTSEYMGYKFKLTGIPGETTTTIQSTINNYATLDVEKPDGTVVNVVAGYIQHAFVGSMEIVYLTSKDRLIAVDTDTCVTWVRPQMSDGYLLDDEGKQVVVFDSGGFANPAVYQEIKINKERFIYTGNNNKGKVLCKNKFLDDISDEFLSEYMGYKFRLVKKT